MVDSWWYDPMYMWWQKRRIYVDNAAGMSGNASSPHEEGRRAKKVLERARREVARLVEVQADDVVFTSGATEANALAVLGTVRAARRALRAEKSHALYLPTAHASIIENMKLLEGEGVVIEPLPICDDHVDIETLAKMLRPETVLVSMEAVCGETGIVWNTRDVATAIHKFSTSVLHVDASQAPLTEKLTRSHFGADLLVFDGAKIGPRGVGVLIAHRTISIEPLYRGGGQERGLRPGSEAPELACAFSDALCAAASTRESFSIRAAHDRYRLIKNLSTAIPNIVINKWRSEAPNILNVSLPDHDTDYVVALLDDEGVAASTKSACESDSTEGSRAVFALTGDAERARSTLRISWSPATRSRDLDSFVRALVVVLPLALNIER